MRALQLLTLMVLLAGAPVCAAVPTEQLPDFELQNWNGERLSRRSFEGHTTIVAFTYAKCVFACPMLTFLLRELDNDLGKPADIRYLHVSVNPQEDTAAEILDHFADHDIDPRQDPRWLFVNGPIDALESFVAAAGIQVDKEPVEGGVLIEHTIRVHVVGPNGRTVKTFDTYHWDRKEMLHALRASP